MEQLSDLTRHYESQQSARDFLKFVRAKAAGPLTGRAPLDLLREQIGDARAGRFQKATIDAMTSTNPLAEATLAATFLGAVQRTTVLGQLVGAVSVPPNQRVPFGALDQVAGFVAEDAPIPVGRATLDALMLGPTTIAIIVAVTKDLLLATDDRALNVLDRLLRRAISDGQDEALLSTDPAVEHEHPGGLLAGVSPVGGGSPDDLDDDLLNVVRACSGGDPDAPIWVVSPLGAAYLRTIDARFQGVTGTPGREGELLGIRQVCNGAAHARAILIDAAAVAFSDGGLIVERSGQAALQLSDTPSAGPQSIVALFQTNAVGLKVQRYLSWAAVPGAVAYTTLPLGSPA